MNLTAFTHATDMPVHDLKNGLYAMCAGMLAIFAGVFAVCDGLSTICSSFAHAAVGFSSVYKRNQDERLRRCCVEHTSSTKLHKTLCYRDSKYVKPLITKLTTVDCDIPSPSQLTFTLKIITCMILHIVSYKVLYKPMVVNVPICVGMNWPVIPMTHQQLQRHGINSDREK